jgi:uncharacterized membrane protein
MYILYYMSYLFFPIIIIIVVYNLHRKINRLEQRINNLNASQNIEITKVVEPQVAPVYSSTTGEIIIPNLKIEEESKVRATEDDVAVKFGNWLKEDWLLKLGALILLMGFGWLASYAFLNNWIGPMGRIVLGIVAGVLFLILGTWRIREFIHQGGVFLVLGSTTILLTIFAAREYYNFFTPLTALITIFLSVAYVAFVSVKYRNKTLVFASLILGSIAPLFTGSPQPNYVGLFTYLLVVLLGVIWVVVITGHRDLFLASLVIWFLYSLPHFSRSVYADKGALLLLIYAFTTIMFVASLVGIIKNNDNKIVSDLYTSGGNGLFLLAWILYAADNDWKSLIIAAWMLVFAIGAFMIYRITNRREPFYIYAAVGVAMLAAATAAELNGSALTIAYTIESGLVSMVAYLALRDVRVSERLNILLAGPVLLSLGSIFSQVWYRDQTKVFNREFFVLLVMAIVVFGIGLMFRRVARESNEDESKLINNTLLNVGSAYFYILLWRSMQLVLPVDYAVMLCLVVYTIVGLATYYYGLFNVKKGLKLYGGVLLGLVVARLILVDVQGMELSGKIITFFLVGSLLISTAFLGRKKSISKSIV